MLSKMLDFIGKLLVIILFLAMIILTFYGVIYLGYLLLKTLAGWM